MPDSIDCEPSISPADPVVNAFTALQSIVSHAYLAVASAKLINMVFGWGKLPDAP